MYIEDLIQALSEGQNYTNKYIHELRSEINKFHEFLFISEISLDLAKKELKIIEENKKTVEVIAGDDELVFGYPEYFELCMKENTLLTVIDKLEENLSKGPF